MASSLHNIAIQAAAAGIITYSECQACICPDSRHEIGCTRILLQEIFKSIIFKQDVLYQFMGILRRMGPPISHYCESIGKTLNNNECIVTLFLTEHELKQE